MQSEPTIGVALSGGGHRAALFGLGVLMYLHDAKKHSQVNAIASVSGGSLTNAYVGQECNFNTSSTDEFKGVAGRLARAIALDGTLYRSKWTRCYMLLLVVTLVACLWASCTAPRYFGIPVFLIAIAVWAEYVFGVRGWVCAKAFSSTLLHRNRRASLLSDLNRQALDHVLCATELHSGEHVYLSGGFVYSYRLGSGTPGSMILGDAVQASAAFPGGFPPRWFRTAPFRFSEGKEAPQYMVLSDGGVYDNMAEQWIVGARRRAGREGVPDIEISDSLILVNASSPISWLSTAKLAWPVMGEWLAFKRIIDILYDNTTAQRRQRLVEESKSGDGLRGTLITIDQTPLTVAAQLVKSGDDESMRERARAVQQKYEAEEVQWNHIRDMSARVPTTLRALGRVSSVNLLVHAYSVASANLHVLMDYPLLETPHRTHFAEMLQIDRGVAGA